MFTIETTGRPGTEPARSPGRSAGLSPARLPLHRPAPWRGSAWLAVALTALPLLLTAPPLQAQTRSPGTAVPPALARTSAPNSAPRPLGYLPGEEVTLARCLRFTVRSFSDRSGPLTHFDWVNLRVRNECGEARRYLLVELVLLDVLGNPYGGRIWVLQRGEILPPGVSKTGNFPLPDPGDRAPRRWAVRVIKVERPRPSRRAALPAPPALRAPAKAPPKASPAGKPRPTGARKSKRKRGWW